jgi:hypothetical protein
MDLLRSVYWSFGTTNYTSFDEFSAAVTERNEFISPKGHAWVPGKVVSEGPVRILFEAMWKDEDDVIDMSIGKEGEALTMGQLLYELHQNTRDFWGKHPGFFEGLSHHSDHTYFLLVGT